MSEEIENEEDLEQELESDADKAIASSGGLAMPKSRRFGRGAASPPRAMGAGPQIRKPTMATAFGPIGKSIECPHCGESISKGYAVKALSILAKADGYDLDEELESFLTDEEMADEVEAEKGIAVKDNKVQSHRGPHKPGKLHHSSRAPSGEEVERKHRPTNPVNEKGMAKSISFPLVDRVSLVEYTDGTDQVVAKSIADGTNHVPSARNLRAEREIITGKPTE